MSKDGGNGIAGASSMEYSEFLQNVHSAWLTGINPYDGFYGDNGTNADKDPTLMGEQGLLGRLKSRRFTSGDNWETEFGAHTPVVYPNVAAAVAARIGEPMAVHQVLPGDSTSSKAVMNPYLSLISGESAKYEINEGLFFDPDAALSTPAAGSIWSNVSERMPRYDAVLNSLKEFAGWTNQGGGAAWANPIGSTAQSILINFLQYYLRGRALSATQAPWVTPPEAIDMPTVSHLNTEGAPVTGEFPDVPESAPTSAHADDLTNSGFPALALLDTASVIATAPPTELSAYDTDDLIAEHMAAKATRSIEESATTIARLTAGMEDIRAVMNTQFIGALTQLESSRLSRLHDMETELKTRSMQLRLQHAATYSQEIRSYQQAKDQFTLANADWKVSRASQYAQAQRLLDDSLDRWNQIYSDWLVQRAVQKGAFDINLAISKDQFTFNKLAAYVQGEAAYLSNTIQANNAMMDIFLKFGEAERASFLQAYDLIRLRMGLELDTTMHNVEVVRRAFTWELETFQYPMNYIASIGGAALQERAPNWGERMLASLSSAASAAMNVGGMTGNPVLAGAAALLTLGAGALTGRG
jgi:hypothetical protein